MPKPRTRLTQYERDMVLLERYTQIAVVSFRENESLTVQTVVDKLAFLLVLAYSREKLARLLSITLAEGAHAAIQNGT